MSFSVKNTMLAAVTFLLMSATPSWALHTGETVHIKVMGLVCDYCAQAVNKVFMGTEKAESVDVDLDKALITLVMKKDQVFSDEEIKKFITDAGYSLDGIHHQPAGAHE